jgi:hypothetical protein
MNPAELVTAITETRQGFAAFCLLGSLLSILCFSGISNLLRYLIRPQIEYRFYHKILDRWLGPFFSKHKIIATFVRLQGLGDTIVDGIANLVVTFIIVAFLSSALTAISLHIYQQGFYFSWWLFALISLAATLGFALIKQLLYFRKLSYRLK